MPKGRVWRLPVRETSSAHARLDHYLLIFGTIAGYIARLLVPGPDPMGFGATLVLGIVGSFVGGFLGYVIFGEDLDQGAIQPAGIFGSIVGAIIALLIWRGTWGRRARAALR
jgi:uncharacterized membrane protein YeaQ/YmgE (transglycosylase-associated protein family)